MDPDMNKYDTEHAVTAHPRMSRTELEDVYRAAWGLYYTPEHLERIMRRAGATGINLSSLAGTLLHFSQFTAVENVHPPAGRPPPAEISPRSTSHTGDRGAMDLLPQVPLGYGWEVRAHFTGGAPSLWSRENDQG